MNKNHVMVIIGLLGTLAYIILALFMFNQLGMLNKQIKQDIYKHYNVPLPKD